MEDVTGGVFMRERPILMTAQNAQRCHEGTKTQTRRTNGLKKVNGSGPWDYPQMQSSGIAIFLDSTQANPYNNALEVTCPYGVVGDRLWIREAHRIIVLENEQELIDYKGGPVKRMRDILDMSGWLPSIHMRREYCRTVVELTEIRVERLQEISEEDAIAEGVTCLGGVNGTYDRDDFSGCWTNYSSTETAAYWNSPIGSYHSLWDSINGVGSWALNPWVWVLTFQKVGVLTFQKVP